MISKKIGKNYRQHSRRIVKWPKTFVSNLVKKQNGLCYWCEKEFGTPYIKNNQVKTLNHRSENLVASCTICNHFKAGKHFNEESDCYLYLQNKWALAIKNRKIILEL